MEIIAQILSILSCAGIILSFQMKNNRHLFLTQTLAAAGFGISYLLLGSFDGFLNNIIAFTNTLVLLTHKLRKKFIMYLICICYFSVPFITLFAFDKNWTTTVIITTVLSFIIPIMQIAFTVATWKDDGKVIRTVRLYAVTPAWLTYNIVIFSIGGIICECFNIISIVVSFIRHGKNGFEK